MARVAALQCARCGVRYPADHYAKDKILGAVKSLV